MKAQEIIDEVEAAGGTLFLDGELICYELPPAAATFLSDLRTHRDEIVEALRCRESLLALPTGIRLVAWEPKRPPVMLTRCSLVVDMHSFVNRTLAELGTAIASTNYSGVAPQARDLIELLEQVGVRVELDDSPVDEARTRPTKSSSLS